MEGITDAFVNKDEVVLSLDRRVPAPSVRKKTQPVVHKTEEAMLEESEHHRLAEEEYETIEEATETFIEEHPELQDAQQEELDSPEEGIQKRRYYPDKAVIKNDHRFLAKIEKKMIRL